jgi:hypothetical protein
MPQDYNQLVGPLYRNCNPLLPATEAQYVDCSPARGDSVLSRSLLGHLQRDGEPKTFLFAGHPGCGKSSELRDILRQLKTTTSHSTRYVPILIQSLEYLDRMDATIEDLLLMLAAQIAETLRAEYDVNLAEGYLQSRFNEFLDLMTANVEISEVESPIKILAAKLKLQQADSEAKKKIRHALRTRHTDLLELINQLIVRAQSALTDKYKTRVRLVLIVDDLEKVEAFDAKGGHSDAQRQLFLDRAAMLTALKADVVYSLSLELARGEGSRLTTNYGSTPCILPMVKIFHRCKPDSTNLTGYEHLRNVIAKRLDPNQKLSDIFSTPALDYLIHYTGGHTRQFVHAVRQAISYADSVPIQKSAAERTIGEIRATYATTIAEAHWRALATLETNSLCTIANHDPDHLKLLEQIAILEYINGQGADKQEPWYAIHPVIRDIPRFKFELSKVRPLKPKRPKSKRTSAKK